MWELTLGQALMFHRYGVEIVTGKDPAKAQEPDRKKFWQRHRDKIKEG